MSAIPSPMMMLPRNWLAAVLGLMMRPQPNEPRNRLTRVSPVTALTRTSQNSARYDCIDQLAISTGGGAAASTLTSSWPARSRISV
jgi:hypothetical protein